MSDLSRSVDLPPTSSAAKLTQAGFGDLGQVNGGQVGLELGEKGASGWGDGNELPGFLQRSPEHGIPGIWFLLLFKVSVSKWARPLTEPRVCKGL